MGFLAGSSGAFSSLPIIWLTFVAMSRLLRTLKWVLISLLGLVLVVVVGTALVTNFYPAFGADPGPERQKAFAETGRYQDGEFQNLIQTVMEMDFGESMKVVSEMFSGLPRHEPQVPLPVLKAEVSSVDTVSEMIWFGHSAFLVKMGGRVILLDPMFGEAASPFTFMGTKRFSDGLPIEIEALPHIDLVVFSHDHYDHLDYPTIKQLAGKVDHYVVPLGVGAHLEHWGVDAADITELDWWEETRFAGIDLACAPARHFSGRGLFNRNSTLWSSWVIRSDSLSLYFSGDGGYGPHFQEIGEKYGPFDLALMECGQYNVRWAQIHMMPEETAQAAQDVEARVFMPIHWGSFALALHTWDDPVIRVSRKAEELNQAMIIPQIGEKVLLPDPQVQSNDWWRGIE